MELWNNNDEILFFKEALKHFASPEQLFYRLQSGYYAYVPKGIATEGKTLQSRNSLIGRYTEKWCKSLLEPIAKELGLFAVNGVVCEELGLSKRSSADLAFCKTNDVTQSADSIKLIFEIKMSIVSNYKYHDVDNIELVGNYKQHTGNPSLLRSDSMLKAIGKSINIRVSGMSSTKIPIIILGNSPINYSYIKKVDYLKTFGVIQGFWSLNPSLLTEELTYSPNMGFVTILKKEMLLEYLRNLITEEQNYFSSMISKNKLGEIISIAYKEKTDILRAEKFLTLIRN
ncbi:MAG: hypothetical protein M0P71_08935 [Melioribacteraceae bacterium]|nr:hypothetical protein [Melioribacteraceae bacterium]